MLLYGKVLNDLGQCSIGCGSNIEAYKSWKMELLDVEKSEVDNIWYLVDKCPHKSDEEKAQEEKEIRIIEIKLQLNELDTQAIRPLRAILTDCATDEDREILQGIEAQANTLREELSLIERQ